MKFSDRLVYEYVNFLPLLTARKYIILLKLGIVKYRSMKIFKNEKILFIE